MAVLDLYKEILNDIRKEDRVEQIRRTERLKSELSTVIKRMDSVQDKYIDGELDRVSYNRLMEKQIWRKNNNSWCGSPT